MGLKCQLDTGKQKFLMSLYFDKNAQTPQNDTVNSWRVKEVKQHFLLGLERDITLLTKFTPFIHTSLYTSG